MNLLSYFYTIHFLDFISSVCVTFLGRIPEWVSMFGFLLFFIIYYGPELNPLSMSSRQVYNYISITNPGSTQQVFNNWHNYKFQKNKY